MSSLYVIENGARLEKEYQRLAVFKEDVLLQRVPLAQVSEVVLIGGVSVTTPALIALLDRGASLSIIRSTGKLLGRLTSPSFRNIPLRHQQYRCADDPDFCVAISKAVVRGKLCNEQTLLRRLCRTHTEMRNIPLDYIPLRLKQVNQVVDLDSLRGLEGSAARFYFDVFRRALLPGWESHARSRRPPRDPLNALLSLGYSLLTQSIMTAIEVAGLDPYDGFFHADRYARPALALDMMEEFRSVIVDSIVLTVINKQIVETDDFINNEEGTILKPHALRHFLKQFSARIQTEVIHPLAGKPLTYQKCFEVQARLMRKAIEEKNGDAYEPFLAR